MPELRRDPVSGAWVVIATERALRPKQLSFDRRTPDHRVCPFCAGNEHMTPDAIYERRSSAEGDWTVRVIPNKYPALAPHGALTTRADGLYDWMSGIGAHEVVIESPRHELELDQMTDPELVDVLVAFRERILDLSGDVRLASVIVFKNHGAAAGASIRHSHSQLIATPVIPEVLEREIQRAGIHHQQRGRCLFCDIVAQEQEQEARIVYEFGNAIAICPYAARSPFEVWVLPKVHASHFERAEIDTLADFAHVLRVSLGAIRTALADPPYNFYIHSSPLREPDSPSFHWHLEIIPKVDHLAGFERGTGYSINPTPPEESAEFLRGIIERGEAAQ